MGEAEIIEEIKQLRKRVQALEDKGGKGQEVEDLKKEIEVLKAKAGDKKGIDWDKSIFD